VAVRDRTRGGLGTDAARPDGIPKVRGDFAFSSDLWADGMLWGRTLRSPHPHARIRTLDVSPALAIPGVSAVVTAQDVPGEPHYGLISADQPVFARDIVRFVGEPVAAVAADHPETARLALAAIVVDYDVLPPLVDPEAAPGWEPIHPDGNVLRTVVIRRGDPSATGEVVVEGTYEVGMQDQAFLGPESGLAVPADDGSIDLHVATQWTHHDRDQVAACLAVPTDMVRLHLAGVGGAFGAREDLSMQVHAALLAKVARRPVKMSYLRDESFVGHVHRHPARIWMRHHADRDGTLRRVEVRTIFDGGAYASSSVAVISNAARFSVGPYRVESVDIEATAVRTNNPPCGAMRGFGSVQVCFAHESQMDRLAAELGMDPVELRLHNALRTGDRLPTGQVLRGAAPVAECIRAAVAHPLPDASPDEVLARPGGAGRTSTSTEIRRGTGIAVGMKNLMYSEGENDSASATVRLAGGMAVVTSAAAEVGQGFVTIAQQIVRELLGVEEVVFHSASTDEVGSAGSTSASRQTWMSGGAVAQACRLIASAVCQAVALRDGLDPDEVTLDGTTVVTPSRLVSIADAVPAQPIEIARLELVRVARQRLEVAHAVVARAGRELAVKRQCAQRGETAGAAAADRAARAVDIAALYQEARAVHAILDVGDAPGAVQPLAIGASETRRAAVVHIEHGDAAAGPVLDFQVQRRAAHRRRPAVAHGQQRRARVVRRIDVVVARRIEERVRRLAVGGIERQRLRAREKPGLETHRRAAAHHRRTPSRQIEPHHRRRGGRRRADEHRVARQRLHIRDVDVRRREHGVRPAACVDRQQLPCTAHIGRGHDRVAAGEGECRLAEHPLRHAELRRHRRQRLRRAIDQTVEIPPTASVRNEVERAVRREGGLEHRLPRAAGDPARRRGPAGAVELGDIERGRVPRHVGVVPAEPREAITVGA